jgi:hypothetical protein
MQKMDEEAETEEAQMPLSQSLKSVTRKIQIKTKGKVFAVVRESYLRNWSLLCAAINHLTVLGVFDFLVTGQRIPAGFFNF